MKIWGWLRDARKSDDDVLHPRTRRNEREAPVSGTYLLLYLVHQDFRERDL